MLNAGEIFERIDVTKYSLKKLVLVPLLILLLALAVLGYSQFSTGSPVKLSMDFTGGTVVKVQTAEEEHALKAIFADFPLKSVRDFSEPSGATGKMLIFGPMSKAEKERLNETLYEHFGDAYEIPRDISGVVGKRYLEQAITAVLVAFLMMAIVVLFVFKTPVPSSAVVLSAFSDIVIATACMNIVGMELSLGTIAALLMLIGYSVDSDILLTTKILRGRGELNEKVRSAMKTGLTMTATTIAAVFAMFFVASVLPLASPFPPIPMLRDISAVLLFGLFADLMNTWMLNAGILRWYVAWKERKSAERLVKKAKKPTTTTFVTDARKKMTRRERKAAGTSTKTKSRKHNAGAGSGGARGGKKRK